MKALFALFLFALFFVVPAGAFDLNHPASVALARQVSASLETLERKGLWPLEIEFVEKAYRDLPRHDIPPGELLELKYVMQQWRGRVKSNPRMGTFPDATLPIYPVKGSKYGWDVWSKDDRFTIEAYETSGEGVRLKGVDLLPGDVILLDQNQGPGDGLMASVVEESRLASHVAVVVFLKKGRSVFPAVVEIHEFGLRAVPLAIFLASRFTSYAEIFRLAERPNAWSQKLSEVAEEMLSRPHSYDLWANEDDDRYLTCSVTGLHLLRQSGAPVPEPRSTLDRRGHLRANLALLGITREKFLMPGDFARDRGFKMVGVVDHQRLLDNVRNELLGQYFSRLLRERRFNAPRFPLGYHINRWGLGQLQRGSIFGHLLLWFYGFTPATLPSGPHDLMALYKILEPRFARSGRKFARSLSCLDHLNHYANHDSEILSGLVSVQRLGESPEIQRRLGSVMGGVEKLFLPPTQ